MPRPTKLTPEVQATIVRAIRSCAYRDVAAAAAGISPGTFYRWMADGEAAPHGAKREFREAVLRAETEAEVQLAATWMRCAAGSPAQFDAQGNQVRAEVPADWRAIRDLLARRHAERWQPKDRLELAGTVQHQAAPEPAELVDGARARVLRLVDGEQVAS